MIEINTFEDLIYFIKTNKLNNEQLTILIESTLKIYICPNDLENITDKLRIFWKEHGNKSKHERPIFLTNPLNNDRETIFKNMLESKSFKKRIDELESFY